MTVEKDIKPGEARCPGVSVQDLLDKDSRPVPDYLRQQDYEFLGDEPIPYQRYTSRDFFDQELDQLWPRVWQWACREEHIPEPGDYVVYDFGPFSVIVTRTESGDIAAFRNACTHRGTKLREANTSGSAVNFRCPYHGWTFDLEGNLTDYMCEWDFPHVDPKEYGLDPVSVGTWGGFVFINLDPDALSLDEYLDPLPDHIESKIFEDRYIAMHVQKELNCNWKIASEAFLEAYHVMETHSQLTGASGDANTQYDFYGDHVNRLINVAGISGSYVERPLTEQEILDSFLVGDSGDVSEKPTVPEGGTARQVVAQSFRDLAASTGTDLSAFCDSEIVDSIAYFIFPNQQFFAGVSFPIVYRFRPIGLEHDRTLFDLILLKTKPSDGSPWETAEPFQIGHGESFAVVPGLDPYIANIYDQDTGNVAAAHQGALTAGRSGATLANYQEVRIRHMHQTLEKYLGL